MSDTPSPNLDLYCRVPNTPYSVHLPIKVDHNGEFVILFVGEEGKQHSITIHTPDNFGEPPHVEIARRYSEDDEAGRPHHIVTVMLDDAHTTTREENAL